MTEARAESPPDTGTRLDVMIPTCGRPSALAVTLAGLSAQSLRSFRVVVSDHLTERPETAR